MARPKWRNGAAFIKLDTAMAFTFEGKSQGALHIMRELVLYCQVRKGGKVYVGVAETKAAAFPDQKWEGWVRCPDPEHERSCFNVVATLTFQMYDTYQESLLPVPIPFHLALEMDRDQLDTPVMVSTTGGFELFVQLEAFRK